MASALDAFRITITNRIKTQWEAGDNTTIIWPNSPKKPPNTGNWIQPSIIWGDAFITTKNGRNRIIGVVSDVSYEGDQLTVVKDGGNQRDVREMRATAVVRIVGYIHVAMLQRFHRKAFQHLTDQTHH